MFTVEFTEDEFCALFNLFTTNEHINWLAYDQAKNRIIKLGLEKELTNVQEILRRRENDSGRI